MKVICNSWEESIEAQKEFQKQGFQLINPKQSMEMKTFVIVFPPCWCVDDYDSWDEKSFKRERLSSYGDCPRCTLKEKPVICSDSGPSSGENYTSLEDVKRFFSLIDGIEKGGTPEELIST